MCDGVASQAGTVSSCGHDMSHLDQHSLGPYGPSVPQIVCHSYEIHSLRQARRAQYAADGPVLDSAIQCAS